MADDWSVELAIKEVFYQLIDDFLFPRIDDFSFRTIKAGVHFRIFFAERKIFNFAPALLLKTLFLFLVLDFFPFWSWKKKSTPKWSELFNSQWNCWMQQIIKQNKDCETSLWKIKMSSSNVVEEELVIKLLQFLNQNMKLSFQMSFHKNLPHP